MITDTVEPCSPGAAASPQNTPAKFATASAALTGISLVLAASTLFIHLRSLREAGPGASFFDFSPVTVITLVVAGVTATLGLIFGAIALGELRESKGHKRGLGQAMFGALAWPLTVIVLFTSLSTAMASMAALGPGFLWFLLASAATVTVGVFVIMAVWYWAKGSPRDVLSSGLLGTAGIAAAFALLPTLAVLVPYGMFTIVPTENGRQAKPRPAVEYRTVGAAIGDAENAATPGGGSVRSTSN